MSLEGSGISWCMEVLGGFSAPKVDSLLVLVDAIDFFGRFVELE